MDTVSEADYRTRNDNSEKWMQFKVLSCFADMYCSLSSLTVSELISAYVWFLYFSVRFLKWLDFRFKMAIFICLKMSLFCVILQVHFSL